MGSFLNLLKGSGNLRPRRQSIGLHVAAFVLMFGVVGSDAEQEKMGKGNAADKVNDPVISPYESDDPQVEATPIDRIVLATLKKQGIESARPCSDEVFIRRVFLDVNGTPPSAREVIYFINSNDLEKRAKLIDVLLKREEFTDYWTLKWCDLLRVKSEFPVNLWPNGVQAYHRWIRDAVKENRRYDVFARQLLTASGSNFRQPAVNFYRAVQGSEP